MDINHKLTIRYDGMDSDQGEIELFSLGESLKGIARIAATTGHFALTEKYSRHFISHDVKVVAHPPKANCFSIDVTWEFVKQHQLLSGSFGVIMAVLIPLVFSKASERRQEMKMLKDSLDKAIARIGGNEKEYNDKLIGIIEKLIEDMKPSVRSAVAPIGKTCDTITIKCPVNEYTYGIKDKEVICKDKNNELTESRVFEVLISELDWLNGTCKVALPEVDNKARIVGKITDPQIENENNPYSIAFAAKSWLSVVAKAKLEDGDIVKLFISDLNV